MLEVILQREQINFLTFTAYEQFYRAGCLLIRYILTDLWYHFGQSDLLDVKMELEFLLRRYLNLLEFL